MYTHLKERQYYEDLYDKLTVEAARRGMVHYDKFLTDFESKLPKGEKLDKPGNAFVVNVFYMQTVGNELIHRYEKRESTINEWIARDEAKDEQIASARLSEEPYCHHCGKQGLRIIDKSLMHRGESYDIDDPKEVLFMLQCPHCEKNSAFWEDGTAWKVKPTLCPKCNSDVTHKTSKTKKAITITYTCTSCRRSFKDRMDLSTKEEEPDPHFDEDRIHFCLVDKEFRDRLFEMKRTFEGMAQLGKEMQEKRDNKHIYDAVKDIKKPKIAELIPLLSEPLEKEGYIEFHLDKPEMGRDVCVGFSCLDSKSDRKDYDSRKTLKKLVDSALEDTNWRLMSDGISYRLGYLNGRVKAYESEEEVRKLVEQRMKSGKFPVTPANPVQTQDLGIKPELDMRESVQVYFDKLTLGSVPAEITLKSGQVKPTSLPVLSGEMHPLLRVFIPMRDNDDSVPKFVRNYDFKFGDGKHIPKVQKDSRGRKIRRTD